jgi:hypothetical protein
VSRFFKGRGKMKRWIFICFSLIFTQLIFPQAVKDVHIPKNIEIEESGFKTTFVRNLSEAGIYQYTQIGIAGDFIYIGSDKQRELYCLNLQGELISKISSEGQGPGSFSLCLGLLPYKGNIAFVSLIDFKLVILTKELRFVKEHKLRSRYMSFAVNNKNEFICNGYGSRITHYFDIYDENGKFLRQFGDRQTDPSTVFETVFIPEKDGLWARFGNRYDLQYYEKEKLFAEIKEKKGFFKTEEKERLGRKIISYLDRGVHLTRIANKLFYFYYLYKDKVTFLDIFDINTFKLIRRIKLDDRYGRIKHHKNSVFYIIKYNEEYEVELYKLEIY